MKLWARAVAPMSALLLAANAAGAEPAKVHVGVVLKGLDNPFFVAMYEGVRAEAGHRAVKATVRAATSRYDRNGQAALARELAAGKNDCYVANPIAATNLIAALRGVSGPIVNIDSPIDPAAAKRAGGRVSTFIGTTDVAAGRLAAVTMISLLPGGGTVALVGGTPDSVNSNRRLRGFEAGIRGTHISVAARVDANYARATAEADAERILHLHPHLSGFFAANDEMALGIVDAVRSAGKTGDVRIIGVDGIRGTRAVRDRSISATVSQYPYVMGQMGVEACIAAVRGASLPARSTHRWRS